jgi:hypothetical protein
MRPKVQLTMSILLLVGTWLCSLIISDVLPRLECSLYYFGFLVHVQAATALKIDWMAIASMH